MRLNEEYEMFAFLSARGRVQLAKLQLGCNYANALYERAKNEGNIKYNFLRSKGNYTSTLSYYDGVLFDESLRLANNELSIVDSFGDVGYLKRRLHQVANVKKTIGEVIAFLK